MKKFLLLSLAALFALASCEKSNEQPSHLTLKLSADTVVLNQDGQLSAQLYVVTPSEYATDKRLTWTSDNECVEVDKNGVITAVSPGQATVFAFINGLNAVRGICTVFVSPITAQIKMTAPLSTINIGDTMVIKYAYSEDVVGKNISLSSSDTIGRKLISYSTNEKDAITVIGIAPGQVYIKATNKFNTKLVDSIELNVVKTPIQSFTFTKTFNTLEVDEKDTLKVAIAPKAAANTPVKWSVNDDHYATVDSEGVVRALRKGAVIVYAATDFGTILTQHITITNPSAKEFGFVNKNLNINIGNGLEMLYPITFNIDPVTAKIPTVEIISNYTPKTGPLSNVSLVTQSNGAILYASHTDAGIGSAALVAYNGSKDKDGKLITDTCFVNVSNYSTNVLVAKAVYNGVDFGSKIAVTAKFSHFINEPITVVTVELVKTVKEVVTVEATLSPNLTISSAAQMEAFNFAPVACSAAQIKNYSVRYTILLETSNVQSVVKRNLVVDDDMALVASPK